MNFIDFNECDDDAVFEADICIVGSGPVGMSVAKEFAGTNVKILILESGGIESEGDVQKLYEIESVGDPRRVDQINLRRRIFGGSSYIWTGRCAPFDSMDFAARDWIPYSGWPITKVDVASYFARAGENLGLGPNCYDDTLWQQFGVSQPAQELNKDKLSPFFWQFSKSPNDTRASVNFGRDINLSQAKNIHVLLHANVTNINVNDEKNEFESVDISTLTGREAKVASKILVLACGGIENARLLLASNKKVPEGLGNHSDFVGRFLMDHTLYITGHFDPDSSDLVRQRFGHYWLDNKGKRHVYLHGMSLSEKIQKEEGLLGCHAFIEEFDVLDDNPMDAFKRLLSALKAKSRGPRFWQDIKVVCLNSLYILKSLYRRVKLNRPEINKVKRVELHCMMEQLPNPNSRVKLSGNKVDALGMPISEINWKISDLEKQTFTRMSELVCEEFSRLGLPVPSLSSVLTDEGWKNSASEKSHPTGSTRMSNNPKDGVVDENLQVHGISNLFVAGSSVFPTSGAANPTLMIVALAIRLSDHLKSTRFSSSVSKS
jgi:choline dehydrogenase-like flavoprotein